jgi:hypothetical protein
VVYAGIIEAVHSGMVKAIGKNLTGKSFFFPILAFIEQNHLDQGSHEVLLADELSLCRQLRSEFNSVDVEGRNSKDHVVSLGNLPFFVDNLASFSFSNNLFYLVVEFDLSSFLFNLFPEV